MWSFSICTFSSHVFCVACKLQQSCQNIYILKIKMNLHPFLLVCGFILITADGFGSRQTHPCTRRTLWPWFLFCLKKKGGLYCKSWCRCMWLHGSFRCKRTFFYKLLFEKLDIVWCPCWIFEMDAIINMDKLTIDVTWTFIHIVGLMLQLF